MTSVHPWWLVIQTLLEFIISHSSQFTLGQWTVSKFISLYEEEICLPITPPFAPSSGFWDQSQEGQSIQCMLILQILENNSHSIAQVQHLHVVQPTLIQHRIWSPHHSLLWMWCLNTYLQSTAYSPLGIFRFAKVFPKARPPELDVNAQSTSDLGIWRIYYSGL